MDARHFDAIARTLSEQGSRRGLLGLLATLPVLGGLFALLDLDETDAKGRRKRRKKKHKHGKGRRRKHHKKCQADSKGKTCSGKCGSVKNNCKKTVDCGSCACDPPCDACFVCQDGPNTPGACVVEPEQQGDACGDPGQFCQPDGACACDASTCANPTPICAGGDCVGCDDTLPCPNGCCDATGACQEGNTTTACGDVGEVCITCVVAGEVCTGGDCVCPSGVICSASGCCPHDDDVCDADDQCCALTTCAAQGKNCGQIPDGCDTGNLDCGNCTPGSTTPLCIDNVCTACSVENPCPSGCCASDGRCQSGTGDGACGAIGGNCVDCGAGRHCVNRQCVCDSTSCPNGCCDGNGQCQVENNLFCGSGGVACSVSCPDSQMCQSGTCVNCSTACAGCTFCFREANGSWHCGFFPSGFDCNVCASSSTCTGGRVCAEGKTFVGDNSVEQLAALCGQPAGTTSCASFTAC
jgi:hypothetical protein